MDTKERTNDQWIADLQQDSPARLQAIDDLRQRLERGLHYYLSHKRSDLVDCSGYELRQIAHSLVQNSLLDILDNLASFRCQSQFTTWTAKFAARVAIRDLGNGSSVQPVMNTKQGGRQMVDRC